MFSAAAPGHLPLVARAGRYLGIYLQDHLLGATAGLELARRAAHEHEGSDLGRFLSGLSAEIEADHRTLLALMRELGVPPSSLRQRAGWAAEKLGRLKPNGRLVRRSPVTPLVELDALAAGVAGKRRLWLGLDAAFEGASSNDDALSARLRELVERADGQLEALEPHRRAAAAAAARAG